MASMFPRLKLIASAIMFGLCIGGVANATEGEIEAGITAEKLVEAFDDSSTRQFAMVYISALESGLGVSNVEILRNGGKAMYCQPSQLALAPEQSINILKRSLEDHPGLKTIPASIVLLMAFEDVFPCHE